MLLHWCILEPAGPSNLAAIRFSTPIRVQCIRVYPTGATPFSQSPEITARTEPEAFFLDLFFNAHPTPDGKQKQKAANALVPSVIAYAGGQMDFTVDMGTECATRLMIVKGAFECVSMAIYGEVVSELPPPPTTYEPTQMLLPEPVPLARSLDPSNSSDPTWLAKELLMLIPESPPLPLVIRLMLCLKPSNEDWELPEFPYLYTDLEAEDEEFDLNKAYQSTLRPVTDDVSVKLLEKFAEKVAGVIGPWSSEQSYLVAGILSNAASQHPEMARFLVQNVDLEQVFEVHMDNPTLQRLLDASTNACIARHLSAPWFLNMISTIETLPAADRRTKSTARKLAARLQQWQILEDALSNTQADFHAAAGLMKDISASEQSFGIWLECMITYPDLLTKLAENPVLPIANSCPPVLLGSDSSAVSHDKFVAFVRAYIGVASVLAVYAWADSLPNDRCRERTLGVLRLWQGVDGYREIVNHLMLLRQMTFRLECMTTDNDPPTHSGVYAEHILLALAHEPASMHSYDLIKCVLGLQQPLSVIVEDERIALRQAALLADDGVTAAIEELTIDSARPLNARRIRTLRVALAIVERELREDEAGEWRILQVLWKDRSHGLVPHLADLFLGVSEDLQNHFSLTPPPCSDQELVSLLFLISDDLLTLIARLVPAYPLTTRLTRTLTAAVADIFVCTDAADMVYAQSSPPSAAAHRTRQTCINITCGLAEPCVHTESGKFCSEVVLRTLLEHGLQTKQRDPAYHLLQVFCLVDRLLPVSPDAEPSHWITTTMSNLLPELRSFFRALDTESKLHFIKRLINLDHGVIGIGEWMLLEELKHLFDILHSLHDAIISDQYHLIGQYQVSLMLQFILELLNNVSSTSSWCLTSITTVPETAQMLGRCFLLLLDGHMQSTHQTQIAAFIARESAAIDPDLKFAVVLILLRNLQRGDMSFTAFKTTFLPALRLLKEISAEFIDADRLQREMGATFSAISESESTLAGFDEEIAEAILSALEWLPERDLVNVTEVETDPFVKLCTSMLSILSPGRTDDMEAVRSRLQASDDTAAEATAQLPERVELSMRALEDLLQPPIPVPSTPKRKSPSQDVLGLVTLSPPTALLRSPSTTGLTKQYLNNDFRQLRQQPSARQNSSRLPSVHIDEFELNSPPISASNVPPMTEGFQSLSPPYNITTMGSLQYE